MRLKAGLCAGVLLLLITGCHPGAVFLRPADQHIIDRAIIDYPPNCELREIAHNLNVPESFCFDPDGVMFVVEGGKGNQPLHIFGKRQDESLIEIYPAKAKLPFINANFKIYGPVGGIAAANGKVFVSHRDENDMGVITAFAYDGSHSTVVSNFPAQGDYGITDIAISSGDGRLFFGVGPATNSGVVGIDNWKEGWLKKHPDTCDVSPVDLKLYGLKFTSPNPLLGFFGGSDTGVTAPFQPFNMNDKTRIKAADDGKANSAIYSISPTGGDLKLVCYGIRLPRGLGVLDYGVYATNDGMELRGTRPINNDPDALVKITEDAYFGFPDYSSDMISVSDARYQPPQPLLDRTGYPDVNPLIDKENSNLPRKLVAPNKDLLKAVFPTESGAAKFDFIPEHTTISPYRNFAGDAIVALFGDRAPFATGGVPSFGDVGRKIVAVNPDNRKVEDFISNTRGLPASKLGRDVVALERPCDVKLAPDGSIYVLDTGRVETPDGKVEISPHTGRIFKLTPIIELQRPAPK